MTTKERVEALWEMLREYFGIETMEQFQREYNRTPCIDISAFVAPGEHPFFPKPK
ncbi:hypothetical protein [Intestinimonas butyriciproducens]|uniref:Uncharacterized protein n=1 Tax=Intestinimonas butyriciproducens TaxID=1297617 RepID=A0A2U1CCJ3_9FIRM|nr:hypothetical protein [Intestinimonas butyriciproducens]MCR1906120.1 hypothetical protein [Intestinimonas butyriciproducens]PVY58571.1 hypothetical protein C7373_104167 [Intestinimonas butyriciproducens]QBB65596.1 hypothetical protein SRB521_01334 [Intestinimonas butyriciproducens]